jgi:hypothetical protein
MSLGTPIAGDGKYYLRWAGKMTGEVSQSGTAQSNNAKNGRDTESLLTGSAIFEQFVLAE